MSGDESRGSAPRSGVRRVAHWILLIAALGYLGYYLREQWTELGRGLSALSLPLALAALILVTCMLALKAVYHVVTIRRLGQGTRPSGLRIASAYALSQLVRYLPGKVMGLVYEIERLSPQVPGHRVIAANIIQSLNTIGLTVGLVAVAFAWFYLGSPVLAASGLALTLAGLVLVHQSQFTERIILWGARRIPGLSRTEGLPPTSARSSQWASLLLLLEWAPFFAFWLLLLPLETASIHDALLLGSCYAFASLAANFAVLAPSGLVLREAIFLWSGSQLGVAPSDLIVLGLVSRLLFTLGDGLLASLVWAADSWRQEATHE